MDNAHGVDHIVERVEARARAIQAEEAREAQAPEASTLAATQPVTVAAE
jgi:hypothetical protein